MATNQPTLILGTSAFHATMQVVLNESTHTATRFDMVNCTTK